MGMTALELYHALGDLLKQDQSLAVGSYDVVVEGCDCFGDVKSVDGDDYQGVVLIRRGDEYDKPLIPTPAAKKALEETQEQIKAALDKRLLEQIKPEFRPLLPE